MASLISMTSSVMCEIAVGLMVCMKPGVGTELMHQFPSLRVCSRESMEEQKTCLHLLFITHSLIGEPQRQSRFPGTGAHLEFVSNNLCKAGGFPVFIAHVCMSTAMGSLR